MVGNTNLFVITKIWWERIFLHIEILASRQDASFYLKNPGYAPIKLESRQEEGCTFLTLNITCVSERSFLENGRSLRFLRMVPRRSARLMPILRISWIRCHVLFVTHRIRWHIL